MSRWSLNCPSFAIWSAPKTFEAESIELARATQAGYDDAELASYLGSLASKLARRHHDIGASIGDCEVFCGKGLCSTMDSLWMATSRAQDVPEEWPMWTPFERSWLKKKGTLNTQLPTDTEWLEHLYVAWEDPALERTLSKGTDDDVESHIQKLISEGIVPERTDQLADILSEALSPRRAFRGQFIETLRITTKPFLGKYAPRVEHVSVALLPTSELNACAMETPRGNPVILLDSGVIFSLSILVTSFLAYFLWDSDDPFSRDHSQRAFSRTILFLADYCATRNSSILSKIETYNLPSRPTYDQHVETSVRFLEKFILLHEYGHVILNHLKANNIRVLRGSPEPLKVYSTSQRQEFEADAFAFARLQEGARGQMSRADIAFFVSVLFRFFGICEAVSSSSHTRVEATHPPARDRWKRIEKLAQVDETADHPVSVLDSVFDAIVQKERWSP